VVQDVRPILALRLGGGHHAFHRAAVLGAVNALRCASTARSARPSGIDRACAQRQNQQLRDGRLRKPFGPQPVGFYMLSSSFVLQTSLERALDDAGVSLEAAVGIEQQMRKEFKLRAHYYINHLPNRGGVLSWLALMQHYGAPTRLLDWTYSFYVAAFFPLAEA